MHTIEDIKEEYRRLDAITGLDTSHIPIVISTRLTRRYGYCQYCKQGKQSLPLKIVIAAFLLEEDAPFWDTIRHEYAHAAALLRTGVSHGHDALWKGICQEVGAAPVRCAPECTSHQQLHPARYIIRCCQCGAIYERTRRSSFVKAVERGNRQRRYYRCKCGSRKFDFLKS